MKPHNHAERSTRLWKFTLYYLLALALPLVASYFLFADRKTAEENIELKRKLERTEVEQKRLLTQLDTLTSHMRRIELTDRQLRTETNDYVIGELNKQSQDYLNSIAVTLSELRSDSTQMQFQTNKRIAHNILRDFDLFRSNRNTIDFLRESLNKRGIDVTDREQLSAQLAESRQLLATYQAAAANRPAPAPSGGGGGGSDFSGGGGGGGSARTAELQRRLQESNSQVSLLSDQVRFANADCLRLRANGLGRDQRKEMLEQSRKGFMAILQNPSSDNMKESVEKMIDSIDKELGRRRGIFSGN